VRSKLYAVFPAIFPWWIHPLASNGISACSSHQGFFSLALSTKLLTVGCLIQVGTDGTLQRSSEPALNFYARFPPNLIL
jgi:hypothetical protein